MLETLTDQIRAAYASGTSLRIEGGGSKAFYGHTVAGDILDSRGLNGIVDYQPKELVLTARAGTPLAEIEASLASQQQMLAFEPPHFGAATLGGCIAAGLSGPRRPYTGAGRDYVLGLRMIDGSGQALRFGGQVIKNVAGYDVSRLMVGALGTLGVITEVSLKVLPRPAAETSLQFEMDETTALVMMNRWAGQALPLSATSWHAGLLHVRLSGAASAVKAAHVRLGGEVLHDAPAFWQRLREQHTPFFDKRPLWRLAVKSTTTPLNLGDAQWIEWGGAVRWLVTADSNASTTMLMRQTASEAGGHATLFRVSPLPNPDGTTSHSTKLASEQVAGYLPLAGEGANVILKPISGVFTPLSPALHGIHQQLKQRFDPKRIFNRGRLYPDL